MKKQDALDYYSDYLIASNSQVSSTGLSTLLDQALSHDYISRALGQQALSGKDYWHQIKKFVRQIERDDSVLSIDDFLIEKPHSNENELISYHYDHSKALSVKGINVLHFQLGSEISGQSIEAPVAYELIRKTDSYLDKKTGQQKRKSKLSKNQLVRDVLKHLVFGNQVKFSHILFDIWFSSSENLKYIHQKLKKTFICPIKSNRLVALSLSDKQQGNFKAVSAIELEALSAKQVYLKGCDFAVQLVRQVFTNKDYSKGELYLISNDTDVDAQRMSNTYQKRWKIEQAHKSLKQNLCLAKSPTKMENSQANHIFATMMAFVKLERIKIKERTNHFALKAKIYLKMLSASMQQVELLKHQLAAT